MKVFFDTNVLISAFLTRGLCADLMRLVLAEHQFMTGVFVVGELRRILFEKFEMPAKKISDITVFLSQKTLVPTPTKRFGVSVRDKDDQWVLSEALSSEADYLVTGDKDLLVLSRVRDLIIFNPRQLWNQLNQS